MKQTIVLGNIITMDEKRPAAKAALVKDGVFAYIGDADEVKKLAEPDAKVLDYGENFIYPGFLESHCHSYLAGDRAIGQANLSQVIPTDYDKYREIIKDFIKANPQREFYMAAGWTENDEYVTKAYLDEICADKILLMQTGGGHSMLLNSKALEWAGIDAAYANKMGHDLVHVDESGEPDGYICEAPVFELYPKLPTTLENAKDYLLAWQDMALANGYTAVADAGVEVTNMIAAQAFYELEQEGKLKLRTYAYLMCPDNPEDPKAEVARIAADRAKYSGEYFHVIGVKTFLDGVTEAHTAWQNQDYADQPGYHGNERFNDHDKMVELITAADAEGLSVHVHSEGGGATHFMLGCIEDAEKITGDLDQRNVLAHLHFVTDEDIRRMAKTGSIPAVPPLWTAEIPGFYDIEVSYVGKELAEDSYPIKSFFDAGAYPVFHSDYPVSPSFSIKDSIYMAETRNAPKGLGIETLPHNVKEAISREQSLRALTINVAYAWHEEHRLGSIEFGKIANMTVYDCDFLHDDIEKVAQANLVATIVDGEEVFKARKSMHLLAEGYDLYKGLTIPVGISNKDMGVEGQEPENAEKLTIDVKTVQGKGKLNLYVFRPEKGVNGEKAPVIYFVHGGGYHFCNVSTDADRIQRVADESSAIVVAPDYTVSLDPSYKYPMELEEVYAGLLYVYEHAEALYVDKDNIVIEGESAGGGLAARLALYNRDKGKVPLKGQVLIYPMLDYRTGGKEDIYNNEYAGEFIWTKENNVFGWGKLLEGQEKKLADEDMIYFSPAVATAEQLKGLPETFMIVGSLDLFCGEDMDYARKLMEAGVFTELYVEPGVTHAYEYLEWTPQAGRFFELRAHATARMLGRKEESKTPFTEAEYGELLKYISTINGKK